MATLATQLEIKTYDDLVALPNDGNRYELIFGEIVMSPAPKLKHQRAAKRLAIMIEAHLERTKSGELILAPFDVKLSATNVVEPDLFVVARANLPRLTNDFLIGPPDLVVEVLSPSNRAQDLVRKANLYLTFGVTEYWVVDPDAAAITVNVLRDGLYAADTHPDGIARSRVFPGLEIDPVAVFAMPDDVTT